eukprot:scaffold115113_cov17-Prasinocladus_malaysianus.AAC.3
MSDQTMRSCTISLKFSEDVRRVNISGAECCRHQDSVGTEGTKGARRGRSYARAKRPEISYLTQS